MDLNSKKYNYSFARPLDGGYNAEWERIVDCEGPYEDNGTMGPPDMFKLEFSGWKRHIEFKPKELVDSRPETV